ncbi:MAG: DUF2147 domain-containing protein [Pseudomonadota bacterium]
MRPEWSTKSPRHPCGALALTLWLSVVAGFVSSASAQTDSQAEAAVSAIVSAEVSDISDQAAIDPHTVSGLWRTPDNVLVAIDPCGESVCGTVIWFPALETADGVVLDTNNDDETLRTREIKGMQIIYGFEKKRKGWRKGRIYDPESGETYKSKLTRLTAQNLKVQGCVGPVCKTFIWTRADEGADAGDIKSDDASENIDGDGAR